MESVEKISVSWIINSLAGKLLRPKHWLGMRRAAARGAVQRSAADAQLKLYADLLPDGFVHFGYFEDPNLPAEAISLEAISQAQKKHAELVVDAVPKTDLPVLDVGCGMGGLIKLLRERGLNPVGVTPDRYQAEHLRKRFPDVTILQSRFEDLALTEHASRYGVVINSESLQYLDKNVVMPLFERLVAPGGRWVICDYLRIAPGHPWSFSWPELHAAISASEFRVVFEREITPHMMPMLRYVQLLGNRFAVPIVRFLGEKVRGREPKIGYLLADIFDRLEKVVGFNVNQSSPESFAREKSYRLLVLERSSTPLA